jgi:hypothetical protein
VFLANHTKELVSVDFFTVATVRFHVLFILVLLPHERCQVVHFNTTQDPTARWTAQQVVEAVPWDSAPRFLLRDRDGVYGADFRRRVQSMSIEEVIIAARSPWQTPYVERMIGSIRRKCLDNMVVLSERHLRAILKVYFPTIITGAATNPWKWTTLSPVLSSRRRSTRSLRSARPAVCTGTTSEWPPDARRAERSCLLSPRSRGMVTIANRRRSAESRDERSRRRLLAELNP